MTQIDRTFYKLYNHFGPQNWWPAQSDIEMMLGAILVQNTSWKNVENVLSQFEHFDGQALCDMSFDTLAELIQASGSYKRKTQSILELMNWYQEYDFNPDNLNTIDTPTLRKSLLAIHGIGEETCDCILLYAFNRPVFVVDAYLRRLLDKLSYPKLRSYSSIQKLMMDTLPHDVSLFQEYHALIVEYGKKYLPKSPVHYENDPLNTSKDNVDYTLKDLAAIPNQETIRFWIAKYGFVERASYPDPFWGSVHTIIGQLISAAAARSIYKRFQDTFPSLESVQNSPVEDIKKVGLPRTKAQYIFDLAQSIKNQSIDFKLVYDMKDDEAIHYLTQIKGFGVWSAKILLIHSFNLLDISSYEDIGLRNGLKKHLSVLEIDREMFDSYLETFAPYKTIASIYLWKINHSSSDKR